MNSFVQMKGFIMFMLDLHVIIPQRDYQIAMQI